MSVLNTQERQVFSSFCLKIGSGALALLHGTLSGAPAAYLAGMPTLQAAAVVVDYLKMDAETCIAACNWISATYPADSQLPTFAAIRNRLETQQAQQTANPIDEIWIGAEPMVNRKSLRDLLHDITGAYDHRVIYVTGSLGSGRSHSCKLIRHVARIRNVPHFLIDFDVPTDERNMSRLFCKLREAFELATLEEPTSSGATPGDIAQKYASRVRDKLRNLTAGAPKRWVIIDFSDEVPDPAVPEFIKLLCAHRADNAFDNCVLFVLGPITHLETMRDLDTMQVEELGPVTRTDILAAAQVVNARGSQRLGDVEIRDRVSTIYDAISVLPEHERYPMVRRTLLKLRQEVRAP